MSCWLLGELCYITLLLSVVPLDCLLSSSPRKLELTPSTHYTLWIQTQEMGWMSKPYRAWRVQSRLMWCLWVFSVLPTEGQNISETLGGTHICGHQWYSGAGAMTHGKVDQTQLCSLGPWHRTFFYPCSAWISLLFWIIRPLCIILSAPFEEAVGWLIGKAFLFKFASARCFKICWWAGDVYIVNRETANACIWCLQNRALSKWFVDCDWDCLSSSKAWSTTSNQTAFITQTALENSTVSSWGI